MDEFSRLKLLIDNKFDTICSKTVLIIGLGGVGGYALESLIRSGINNIIIVDGDKIEKSNLNRQIIALNSTIGQSKTEAFLNRIKDINSSCHVKVINEFIDINNIDLLFENNIDYLIDACDTIDTKKLIIKNCLEKKIKFITCCGTGNKLNPLKLDILEVDKTNYDPIAKILRKYKKELHTKQKIMVVSSNEEKKVKNTKTIPSISFVPAVAGMLLSYYVINDIIKGDIND